MTTCSSGSSGEYMTQVGVEVQQCVDVGGGGDADHFLAGQFGGVAAVLVGAVHPTSDQFEFGMAKNALDRGAADAAGRPE